MQLLDCFAPEIDLLDPVVRSHQLNLDRTVWFLALPGLMGGSIWLDLMGGLSGTLTSFAIPATTSGWMPTQCPGGFGRLVYDNGATGQGVYVNSAPAISLTDNYTMGMWLNTSDSTRNTYLIFHEQSAAPGTGYGLLTAQGTGALMVEVATTSFSSASSNASVTNGLWNRVIVTRSGSTVKFYINGVLDSSPNTLSSGSTSSSTQLVLGGYGLTDTTQYFVGSLNDVFLASRVWTQKDVTLDYQLSRLGYPGVLNRAAYQYTPSAPSFQPAWAANSNTLYTGQIYV